MPGRNPPTQFCKPKFTCFHQIWREKKWKTLTEYGHKSWSRNRCWAYNIPNRSSFRPLQICWDEIYQPTFLGQNSLLFIRFGGKKIEKLWLTTAITLDPEIVAVPIIYQIEALFELYKYARTKSANSVFFGQNSLVFFRFGWKKNEKLWLNTAISLDPEIVVGPIIYQIEALFDLYKYTGTKSANLIF